MRMALIVVLTLGGVLAAGCMTVEHGDTPTSLSMTMDKSSNQFDPVCGLPVNVSSALKETWDSRTYYFHSAECRDRFHSEPYAFVPGAKVPAPVQEVR
jgi:YHS domain-containing protein